MPAEPKKDKDGWVIPHDHPEVENAHNFVRRISEQCYATASDGVSKRLSSAAFSQSSVEDDPYESVSGDLEQLILEDKIDPGEYVTSAAHPGAIKVPVGALRENSCLVGWDPMPDNKYHGAGWPKNKLTSGQKKKLLRAASWLVEIPGIKIIE